MKFLVKNLKGASNSRIKWNKTLCATFSLNLNPKDSLFNINQVELHWIPERSGKHNYWIEFPSMTKFDKETRKSEKILNYVEVDSETESKLTKYVSDLWDRTQKVIDHEIQLAQKEVEDKKAEEKAKINKEKSELPQIWDLDTTLQPEK